MFLAITFIYNLDKKKVATMTAELAERRAATQAPATETVETVEVVKAVEEVVDAATIDEDTVQKE